MNRVVALVPFLAFALAAFAADPPARPHRPAVDVPPPPAIDDPGVETREPGAPAGADAPAPAAAAADDDPLAPLPKPDTRLVRDKASRAAAPDPERMAASDVTTRREGDDTVEEYRQAGRLWMVRIHPKNGPMQTFVDTTGSGQLTRNPDMGPVAPVYYTIYEWK
jgi:hypothetical protein